MYPSKIPDPAMTEPEIRLARADEGPALTELAHRAKRSWNYPEAWIEAWRDDLEIGEALIEKEEVWVVPGAGDRQPLACAVLASLGGGRFDLGHMWVDPEAHGRGLGRRLFEHLVERARKRGGSELEVVSDPNAVAFYQRLGCEPSGEHHGEILGEPRVLPILRYTL